MPTLSNKLKVTECQKQESFESFLFILKKLVSDIFKALTLALTLISVGWLTSHTSKTELAVHVLTSPLGEVRSFHIEKEEILELKMDHSQSPTQ